MTSRVRTSLAATLLLALGWGGRMAAAPAVPVDVQVALFVNIWKLDRNLDRPAGVTVAVLYQKQFEESVVQKDEFLAAAAHAGTSIHCIAVEVGSQALLLSRLAEVTADIVYVTPLRSVNIADVARLSRERRMRTITGVPEYVDAGLAVGIGLHKNRPLIIINVVASRLEGAAFSSQLLNLARIVGPLGLPQ